MRFVVVALSLISSVYAHAGTIAYDIHYSVKGDAKSHISGGNTIEEAIIKTNSSGEQVLVIDSGNYAKCLISKEFVTKYNLSLVELARTLVNEDSELVCGLTSSWTGKEDN